MATDVNETFAWVRISWASQDLVYSWKGTPGALQERRTATAKPELLAQASFSQGKVFSLSFGEFSGFSVSFLVFAIVKVGNLPLMIIEISALV